MASLTSTLIRSAVLGVLAVVTLVPAAMAAPSDAASCVGQFSSFFAQGGEGTHRSLVAQGFAWDARPAGLNVYSHVAEGQGSLEACFEMFG